MIYVLSRSTPPALALVRKLVAVLESIEKLPVYTYDSPSSGYGLQVLYRVQDKIIHGVIIHVLLEPTSTNLVDFST